MKNNEDETSNRAAFGYVFGCVIVCFAFLLGFWVRGSDVQHDTRLEEIKMMSRKIETIAENIKKPEPEAQELPSEKVQNAALVSESDRIAANEFLQSEEACQACVDYYVQHEEAQREFAECEIHWYFSTHMADVCTFQMRWEAPSGKTINVRCPGFNNKFCPGPMFLPSFLPTSSSPSL